MTLGTHVMTEYNRMQESLSFGGGGGASSENPPRSILNFLIGNARNSIIVRSYGRNFEGFL